MEKSSAMAIAKRTRAAAKRRGAAGSSRASETPAVPASAAVAAVVDAAAGGQHSRAIEIATAALAEPGGPVAEQLTLLALRGESRIALGALDAASEDADAMIELAKRARAKGGAARALCLRAAVRIRAGNYEEAVPAATAAWKDAKRAGLPRLEALALLLLAEAESRQGGQDESCIEHALAARKHYDALGDASGAGRAMWVVSMARSHQGRAKDADAAAHEALALCKSAGDQLGIGNALNMLNFNEGDLGKAFRNAAQAIAAFEACGHVERQAMMTINAAIGYDLLGLAPRALRMARKGDELYARAGAWKAVAWNAWRLADAEISFGRLDRARAHVADGVAKATDTQLKAHAAVEAPALLARIAREEGRFDESVKLMRRALAALAPLDTAGPLIERLHELAQSQLGAGQPRAALATTRRAIALHRKLGLGALQGLDPETLWWRHSLALAANGRDDDAWEALERAYGFICQSVGSLGDEGLRRNALNKPRNRRDIVAAWLRGARRRKLPAPRRLAHLQGETHFRAPFERLVDTGLRLNELRTTAELHEFLIEEATELTGGERVLLVLETPQGRALAGASVPRGEQAEATLRRVAPWLDEAHQKRSVILRHDPRGTGDFGRRSRIVAPLVARREVLGCLYADVDEAFGPFHDGDRDLVGMLAAQAAVALDNARWAEGLEREVAQRTAEARSAQAQAEQRAGELALINSIQQGIASKLDFQGIVDLVGDRLGAVFGSEDLSIRWWDDQADTWWPVYAIEHGIRLDKRPPRPVPRDEPAWPLLHEGIGVRLGTRAEQLAAGMKGAAPGTDWCLAIMAAPIRSAQRVLGAIVIENHEREHAFGEADLRVLATIGATLGTALENALLFDETQRLLKETEERNAELAVINSIQQGVAGSLDFQGDRGPRRGQAARGLRHRRHGHPLAGREDRRDPLPLRVRAWRAAPPGAVHGGLGRGRSPAAFGAAKPWCSTPGRKPRRSRWGRFPAPTAAPRPYSSRS